MKGFLNKYACPAALRAQLTTLTKSKKVSNTKKPFSFLKGFLNKYGNYLLSHIFVQYHRP
jgi:hypothetical protein